MPALAPGEKWQSGVAGSPYPFKDKGDKDKGDKSGIKQSAGDAPGNKDKKKSKKDDKGGKGKGKGGKDSGTPKRETSVTRKGKKDDDDGPDLMLTPSQIAHEEQEYRAMIRRQNLCKRNWPSVTKVKIKTKPWHPPGPPEKVPRVLIQLPPLETKKWIPPYRRRRRRRPKLARVPAAEITKPLSYEGTLKKIWHAFQVVDMNKMMIQGTLACNSKRYVAANPGAQTGAIAVVCRALLEEKSPAQLIRQDVDDVIHAGDRFYKECTKVMKCYKGKPQLELNQLINTFFFNDLKYTFATKEVEKGILAKSPDNPKGGTDLLALLEKRAGSNFMFILTVDGDKHFLIWGHPPASAGQVKTVVYIFEPHMLDQYGSRNQVAGAGGFLRYPGVSSFVIDFLNNHGDISKAKKLHPKPPITLTNIDIINKERLLRVPGYDLDLKSCKVHCHSEWNALNMNALIDKKLHKRKYPLASLSAVSLATSRKSSKRKVREFFQKGGVAKDPKLAKAPTMPVAPEKPPALPTTEQFMQMRGEGFFLYSPKIDAHMFGRDDMIPLPKSETMLHSPVEIADRNFQSQFVKSGDKAVLRGTRHFASMRYTKFKNFTGVACCVAALGMLRRLRGRAWNEDTVDETLDVGWNLFRESLMERKGPVRRLVLGELAEKFLIRDKLYKMKERGIAVWGKLVSNNPKVFDLCRGIESFFKESDSGVLQIPGEYETAIWNEGGMYYLYHPWPADKSGMRVSLQGGGKACVMRFAKLDKLCEAFMDNVKDLKRKPFSISDVGVFDLGERAKPINNMKAVSASRWVVRGNFHEGNDRFKEDHRNKQATPTSIAAIAMASLIKPDNWTPKDIDETLIRGDLLYEKTMEHLDKLGINLETTPAKTEDTQQEKAAEEEEEVGVTGTLAAIDVLPRFKISEFDCIETEVQDSAFTGELTPTPGSSLMTLKNSLAAMFRENNAAIVTARGQSMAVWKQDGQMYFFDPHGCDENGLPSEESTAGAALIRMKSNVKELADVIMGNLSPGSDNSFNLSPVEIMTTKLNPQIGAPEIQQEGKAFEWLNKHTATILMGPRGQNSAIGKAATRALIPKEDLAGRILALPAAAAFTAATEAVQPPGMHQDHMFNFLEAGADYYLNHMKKTGRKDITVADLGEKFEMGANTFSIEVGEPMRLPLRLPDKSAEGGGEEEEPVLVGEGAPKETLKQMKELLFKMWYDTSKPTSVYLLLGDYYQLGLWMTAGGKVVAFDPAPTLAKGLLTKHRKEKGDELRAKRMKEEKGGGEGAEEEAEDEEVGGEGEEKPEPEPEFVPPEACPALMVFASPGEFIDKLVLKGGLDNKQAMGPSWLYPVKVTNELTSVLKEKKPSAPKAEGEEEGGEEGEEEVLIEPLAQEAIGKNFTRNSRTVASLRGCVAQDEGYFMDAPNRNNQDAANAVMAIVVENIEPYIFWKPALIDAILKYGDRLYTMSASKASNPPQLKAQEIVKEFHVTNFNVKIEVTPDVVSGDIKAGDTGSILNLKKGIKKFFETGAQYGVMCAKGYCVSIWKAKDGKALVYWDAHTIGPKGQLSPASAAGAVIFSGIDELAEAFRTNVESLSLPGTNMFTISTVKPAWEFSRDAGPITPQGAVPDEGYEWKVLTAYVETARGRTILRGSRPPDLPKFTRDALMASSASAIVAACMSHVRRPHLWTRKTVDEIMSIGCSLFTQSLAHLGYEFAPGEDILLPLQVLKRFVLGVNYIRYDLDSTYVGRLEQREHTALTVRCALERFFEGHTHGILWCTPHAVAVWRVAGAPSFYMMEPHATGPTGLRTDAQDDGAASVLTFTSAKLMAFAYLQNIPKTERIKHEFVLYAMSVSINPIKNLKTEPPILKARPGTGLVSATSKVDMEGRKRRADEDDRQHPPGTSTCLDAQKATLARDKDQQNLKGERNSNGWLVLNDGTQFLSASHSMACKRFPYASRGNQALACSVMAVAMSRVEDVCRWCNTTLDAILDSGDQLYQDSYLHFRPQNTPVITIEQVLRKFYTPGNCVCRVVVYQARQKGPVDSDLTKNLTTFFSEERAGVFVANGGEFAVALFKTPKGFYMFDPGDRDRYGRAVAPPCTGKARACFSQYPTVKDLAKKLSANIPPRKHKPELPVSPTSSVASTAAGPAKGAAAAGPAKGAAAAGPAKGAAAAGPAKGAAAAGPAKGAAAAAPAKGPGTASPPKGAGAAAAPGAAGAAAAPGAAPKAAGAATPPAPGAAATPPAPGAAATPPAPGAAATPPAPGAAATPPAPGAAATPAAPGAAATPPAPGAAATPAAPGAAPKAAGTASPPTAAAGAAAPAKGAAAAAPAKGAAAAAPAKGAAAAAPAKGAAAAGPPTGAAAAGPPKGAPPTPAVQFAGIDEYAIYGMGVSSLRRVNQHER